MTPQIHFRVLAAALHLAAPLAAQDDGDLDPRWGSGGFARLLSPATNSPGDVACAGDGTCYVAYLTNAQDFGIARVAPAGTFSGGSSAAFNLGGSNTDWPFAAKVGADGKPVVAGFAADATPEWQMAAARFSAALASGLDPGFAGDGKATQNFAGTAIAHAVAVGPSGETVIAGCYAAGGSLGADFAIVRLLPDGSPDNGFDANGVRTLNFDQNTTGPSDDCAEAVAIQPDGRIVVAGSARYSADDYDFAIARLNVDGTLDATFSPGGTVGAGMHTVGFDLGTSDDDKASGVAIDRFGRILLAGYADADSAIVPALVRLLPNGAPDTAFDNDGRFLHPTSVGSALAAFPLAAPGDRIVYATGMGELTVLTEDGDLDSGFGLDGSILIDDPAATSTHPPVALTVVGGMPVVVGESVVAGTLRYFVARYWMDQIFGDDFESGNTAAWRGW